MGRLLAAGLVVLAVLVAPSAAGAAWSQPGGGSQSARALGMPAGGTPTASVSNRSVTVSWPQRTIGGVPVGGYVVRRYDGSGQAQMIGASCTGTVAALSCTEDAVPPGSWRYAVEPRHGNWAGAEGPMSAAVAVASPSLSFSSSTELATLPATLSGTLAAFIPGQTVTFRLDDAATGTVLSGTVTPSTIPAGGGASVTVTVPAGTSAGLHTIYAVGTQGDVASAGIEVLSTVTTAPFDLRDGSSGTLVDVSQQSAFAGDGRTFATTNWAAAFAGTRYVDLDMNGPLPPALAVSGAGFDFRYAATRAADTACFWFEVRRISTGVVLGTHGSALTPVGCVTGTGHATVSAAIPEVNTTDLANDVRIRVYGRNSGARPFDVDMARVTGSTPAASFTLYEDSRVDAADGSAAGAAPWPIGIQDGVLFEVSDNWPVTFGATAYVRTTFPAYVPAAASVKSATLRHVWRPSRAANTMCWYAEVYSGGALIGSHGSAGSPISCPTGAAWQTDSVSLPELNTPARANDATVRMYFQVTGGGNRRTEQDLAELTVLFGQ